MRSDDLKSVNELLNMSFNVPYYQRGFRWKEEQVRQLLDDLTDFRPTAAAPFYFFQALVIAEGADSSKVVNVVDGQQRLTTLDLLLKELGVTKNEWLKYERNSGGQTSFGALDEHYRKSAQEVIKGYLNNNSLAQDALKEKMLSGKFLVYRIHQEEELNTFSRLNSGKIRAKDSELIKCIMLTPQDDEPMSVTRARAQEWDFIERAMNHDPFFSFFTARETPREDDRMAMLFKWAGFNPAKVSRNVVFPFLSLVQERLKGTTSRIALWKDVYTAFYRLADWFDDPVMYHAVGWLVHRKSGSEDMTVLNICERLAKDLECLSNKSEKNKYDLYSEHPEIAYNYLLLFNMAHCWRRWPLRYDFCQHRKIEAWSLEHIFARNQADFDKKADLEKYLGVDSLEESMFKEYQEECKNIKGDKWLQNWMKIQYGADYPESEDNSLGNLALLGKSANSSLSNHCFMTKRAEIISWSARNNDYWVPPATEAVFLKSLPRLDATRHYWTGGDNGDRTNYVEFMKTEISDFVGALKVNCVK